MFNRVEKCSSIKCESCSVRLMWKETLLGFEWHFTSESLMKMLKCDKTEAFYMTQLSRHFKEACLRSTKKRVLKWDFSRISSKSLLKCVEREKTSRMLPVPWLFTLFHMLESSSCGMFEFLLMETNEIEYSYPTLCVTSVLSSYSEISGFMAPQTLINSSKNEKLDNLGKHCW